VLGNDHDSNAHPLQLRNSQFTGLTSPAGHDYMLDVALSDSFRDSIQDLIRVLLSRGIEIDDGTLLHDDTVPAYTGVDKSLAQSCNHLSKELSNDT
jgi:hypothetical protein